MSLNPDLLNNKISTMRYSWDGGTESRSWIQTVCMTTQDGEELFMPMLWHPGDSGSQFPGGKYTNIIKPRCPYNDQSYQIDLPFNYSRLKSRNVGPKWVGDETYMGYVKKCVDTNEYLDDSYDWGIEKHNYMDILDANGTRHYGVRCVNWMSVSNLTNYCPYGSPTSGISWYRCNPSNTANVHRTKEGSVGYDTDNMATTSMYDLDTLKHVTIPETPLRKMVHDSYAYAPGFINDGAVYDNTPWGVYLATTNTTQAWSDAGIQVSPSMWTGNTTVAVELKYGILFGIREDAGNVSMTFGFKCGKKNDMLGSWLFCSNSDPRNGWHWEYPTMLNDVDTSKWYDVSWCQSWNHVNQIEGIEGNRDWVCDTHLRRMGTFKGNSIWYYEYAWTAESGHYDITTPLFVAVSGANVDPCAGASDYRVYDTYIALKPHKQGRCPHCNGTKWASNHIHYRYKSLPNTSDAVKGEFYTPALDAQYLYYFDGTNYLTIAVVSDDIGAGTKASYTGTVYGFCPKDHKVYKTLNSYWTTYQTVDEKWSDIEYCNCWGGLR